MRRRAGLAAGAARAAAAAGLAGAALSNAQAVHGRSAQACGTQSCTATACYVPGVPTPIISGPPYNGQTDNVDGVKVLIHSNFATGDILELSAADAAANGVTATWDAAKVVLTISGTKTVEEYGQLITLVTLTSTDTSGVTKRISWNLGTSVFDSDNGHFYEYFSQASIRWTAARDDCLGRTLFGYTGYLVTITSAAENAFAAEKLAGDGWIGASDAAVEGTWRWVTGCEAQDDGGAGQHFWTGAAGGAAVGGAYVNWETGEPNDALGEDYGHLYGRAGQAGRWNDFAEAQPSIQGYVCEWGGNCPAAGAPTLPPAGLVDVTACPPTDGPTAAPSSSAPTLGPSSSSPSAGPSESPTSAAPTASPTASAPSSAPTAAPVGSAPSTAPSAAPSAAPTGSPSAAPSGGPSSAPSAAPTAAPTTAPSASPSAAPSTAPSAAPTTAPSPAPTTAPTREPSGLPSRSPTAVPSRHPSVAPSPVPTVPPSANPSVSPSARPSTAPSVSPSATPSLSPSVAPSQSPTAHACDDGSHTCGNLSLGVVCSRLNNSAGFSCGCAVGYECVANCTANSLLQCAVPGDDAVWPFYLLALLALCCLPCLLLAAAWWRRRRKHREAEEANGQRADPHTPAVSHSLPSAAPAPLGYAARGVEHAEGPAACSSSRDLFRGASQSPGPASGWGLRARISPPRSPVAGLPVDSGELPVRSRGALRLLSPPRSPAAALPAERSGGCAAPSRGPPERGALLPPSAGSPPERSALLPPYGPPPAPAAGPVRSAAEAARRVEALQAEIAELEARRAASGAPPLLAAGGCAQQRRQPAAAWSPLPRRLLPTIGAARLTPLRSALERLPSSSPQRSPRHP